MLYLKILLCVSIISLSLTLSVKIASKSRMEAEVLRAIAHEFMLFKDGISIQNKSFRKMAETVAGSNSPVKSFFDCACSNIQNDPEMPLECVLHASCDALNVTDATKSFLKNEMNFIASLFNQHTTDIFVEGLNNSCNRIELYSDKIMDKYSKNVFLYKRVGVLLGIIFCMFVF